MKQFRLIMFVMSFICVNVAFCLSFNYNNPSTFNRSGIDGGAAGFAILSGLTLIAASITYLKDEN